MRSYPEFSQPGLVTLIAQPIKMLTIATDWQTPLATPLSSVS
jgi:hypothetical protein